jgi:hypothetical protein
LQERQHQDQNSEDHDKGQLAIQRHHGGKLPAVGAPGKGLEVDENNPDDFPKAQGDDGEVIPGKLEYRKADQKTRKGGEQGGARRRQGQGQAQVKVEENAGLRANGQEARLPQGKLPGNTHYHIDRHGHNGVYPTHGEDMGRIYVDEADFYQ